MSDFFFLQNMPIDLIKLQYIDTGLGLISQCEGVNFTDVPECTCDKKE